MRELSFDDVDSVPGGKSIIGWTNPGITFLIKAGGAYEAASTLYQGVQSTYSSVSSWFNSSSSTSMLTTSSSGVFSFGGSPSYPGSYGSGASSGDGN